MSNIYKQVDMPMVLNVPLALLKLIVKNDSDYEMLLLSMMIKFKYGDSLMKDVSITGIQHLLGCGFYKAKDIFNRAKHRNLFVYNAEKNTLLAKNFKKKFIKKKVNRKGEETYDVYCIKIDNRQYSLRSLKKEVKKEMIKSRINAIERKDEFHRKRTHTNSFIPRIGRRHETFKNLLGYKSRTSVVRLISELESNGEIKVTRKPLLLITSCCSDEALATINFNQKKALIYDGKRGMLYQREPNSYTLLKKEDRRRFAHIILNHERRTYGVTTGADYRKHAPIVNSAWNRGYEDRDVMFD